LFKNIRNMGKILGLDLGTNSIGWAIRNPEKEGNQIIKKGAVIFPKGVGENQTGEYSKASERTKHRGTRRLYQRRKKRKTKLLKILIDNDMCPLSREGWEKWAVYKKGRKFEYPQEEQFKNWIRLDFNNDGKREYKNPYEIRKDAVQKKLSPEHIGRALYHICQRRGFKSNRLDETSDNEETKIHTGSSETKTTGHNEVKEMIENSELGTLGAAFAELNPHKQRIRNTYTLREDYLNEFEKICNIQQLDSKLAKKIKNAIFYQRPLKSQKGNIGPCSFEFHWYYDKKNSRWRKSYARRCPKSHPVFEQFRMLSFINSIKVKRKEDKEADYRFLTDRQKDKIYSLFYRVSALRFNFEDIAKKLDPGRNRYSFNYKDYHSIAGCPTISKVKNIIGNKWNELKAENRKNHKDKSPLRAGKGEVSQEDIWHVLFSFEDQEKLKEWPMKPKHKNLSLSKKEAEKFSEINLKQGYAQLSLRALRKILPFLREGMIYSHAVFAANISEIIGKKTWNENKDVILKDIKNIIDDHNRINRLNYIINDLISDYLDNPPYGITINEWLESHFEEGSDVSDQNGETLRYIKRTFKEQIRVEKHSNKFIQIERLDEKIKDYLADNFDVNDRDLAKLYHPSDIDIYPEAREKEDGKRYLGSPETGSFKNPMALKTLYELKHLINYMIEHDVINENDKIIIEMARELNSANKRRAIERWNREREQENQEFKAAIKDLFSGDKIVTDEEIKKYRLWKEQDGIDVYTGRSICMTDLFNGTEFEIEHTLPRSQSFDNSLENLTVCDKNYNRNIKQAKLPAQLPNYDKDVTIDGTSYTAIKPRLRDWEEKVEDLDKQLSKYKYPWGNETKEQKDRRIRQRHYWRMKRDYWSEKLYRFKTEKIKSGFKNSQLIDTQIVTKYARAYLKTVFGKVYSVNGSVVAEFRKLWGLQDEFAQKERLSHIHHTIDAAVISCLTKDKYDRLAQYYHNQEMYAQGEQKNKPFFNLPWKTFVSDIQSFENDTLIVHKSKDTTLKQTKRKLRKNGKIQYKTDNQGNPILDEEGNKIPIYEQGMGIRGQLHLDTFYGAIKQLERDKEGNVKTDEEGNAKKTIKYVLRRPLEYGEQGFKTKKQLESIVDPVVRQKVLDHVESDDFKSFKDALDHTVWMNKEKGIPIKRVRCYARDVKNPLKIKKQSHTSEGKRRKHKEFYYAKNESNYAVAIYQKEKDGKFKRSNLPINKFEVSEALQDDSINNLYPTEYKGKPFYCELKRGDLVLFYESHPDEINYNNYLELSKRLYKVIAIATGGRIRFKLHSDSRNNDRLREDFKKHYGKDYDKTLVTGKSKFELNRCFPKLNISPTNLNIIPINGSKIELSTLGEISLVDDIS